MQFKSASTLTITIAALGVAAVSATPLPAGAATPLRAAATPVHTLAGARILGRPEASRTVDFLLHFPLRNVAELQQLTELQGTRSSPVYHQFLTPAQFRARYGPTQETLTRAAAALRSHGLEVTSVTSQFIGVRGPVAAVERAFATRLAISRDARGSLAVAATDSMQIPSDLRALGASVHGLHQSIAPRPRAKAVPLNRYGPIGAYWFDDLKQAYSYPSYSTFTGKGITIATVGASDFSSADASLYFGHEKLGHSSGDLGPAPVPRHYIIPGSLPFDVNSGDSFEANLDVQQAAGSAPGATVYNVATPNLSTGEGFLYAYSVIDESNAASIVSTSYGSCELFYTAAYSGALGGQYGPGILQAYHDLFLQGNAQGITFITSSGDNAGLNCPPVSYFTQGPGLAFKSIPSVDSWGDDPNVTGVGGTTLVTSAKKDSLQSTYVREEEYADALGTEDPYGTGNTLTNDVFGSTGGESAVFAKPAYQSLVNTGTRKRAVPDISMHMGGLADARSYDAEYFGGTLVGVVGTSASAPEFAGLVAVAAQSQGGVRFGNINPLIYEFAHNNGTFPGPYLHQDIAGYNGVVTVTGPTTYNVITGVGTPIANRLLLLPRVPLAGSPQSPSNP